MKKTLVLILLVLVCLPAFSQSFDSFVDVPEYRDKFVGTWTEDTERFKDITNKSVNVRDLIYNIYKFNPDGTGIRTRKNDNGFIERNRFTYKVTDSQIFIRNSGNSRSAPSNYVFIGEKTATFYGSKYRKTAEDDTPTTAVAAASDDNAQSTRTPRASRRSRANDEDSDNGEPAAPPRFNVTGAFSYYPPSIFDWPWKPYTVNLRGSAPGTKTVDHGLNLSLQMGLNLFKSVSAYVDFGFDNKEGKKVKDLLNIMAKLNVKLFTLQFDYRLINNDINFWKLPGQNYGYYGDWADNAMENRDPDITIDSARTWMTTALMFNLPKNEIFEGMYFGLVFITGEIPSYIQVSNPSFPVYDNDYVFLTTVPVWAVGVRGGVGWDHNSNVPDEIKTTSLAVLFPSMRENWGSAVKLLVDLGFGKAEQDEELIKEVTELREAADRNYYKDDSVFYMRMYGSLGLYREQKFGKNKSWIFGFGLEANAQGFVLGGDFEPIDMGLGLGFYFNLGFKF